MIFFEGGGFTGRERGAGLLAEYVVINKVYAIDCMAHRRKLGVILLAVIFSLALAGCASSERGNKILGKSIDITDAQASGVGISLVPKEEFKLQNVTVESATIQLIEAAHEHMKAPGPSKSLYQSQLRVLAGARKALLLANLDNEPTLLVRYALPGDVMDALPSGIIELVEKESVEEGTLQVIHLDDFAGKTSDTRYFIDTDKGRYFLYFEGMGKRIFENAIEPESKIWVSGLILDNKIVVQNWGEVGEPLLRQRNIKPWNMNQKVAVILFDFQDNQTDEPVHEYLHRSVFTDNNSVSAYYRENSYLRLPGLSGKYNLSGGDVFGWYTVPYNSTQCSYDDVYNWLDAADSAAISDGVNLDGYDHKIYVYYHPQYVPGCNYLAYFGDNRILIYLQHLIHPSYYDMGVITHELGHSLGVYHANRITCYENGTQVPISNNCTNWEYGDNFDVMGSGYFSMIPGGALHLNNHFKEFLGWYRPENILTVNESGNYSLYPIEFPSQNQTQAIRIPYSLNDVNFNVPRTGYLYLQNQIPQGFDWIIEGHRPAAVDGITIRYERESGTHGYLIDTNTTGSQFGLDAPLRIGQTLNDSEHGLMIKLLEKNNESALVELNVTPVCVRGVPDVSLTPRSQWGNAGETLGYTLQVNNTDNQYCNESAYVIVAVSFSDGLTVEPFVTFPSIPQGGSVLIPVNVTSAIDMSAGSYNFTYLTRNADEQYLYREISGYYNVLPP